MLRIFTVLVFCLFSTKGAGGPFKIEISSESGILINAETGTILFEKNAHTLRYPASITKIATALYVLRTCGNRLDQIVTVKSEALASISPQAKRQSNYRSPPHWLETDGNHMGMKKGEEIPLRHLLYAMLISSANDAANVIAQHIGGSIPKFMERLNAFLKEIGCQHTHFLNPHGFHHPEHVTTAYDMALIAREAMKHHLFREIVSTVRYTCPATNLEGERNFIQTNLLLRQGSYFYPKAIGIKTGTTSAAGKTLVAAAKGDRILISVTLGNRDKGGRYEDVTKLFEAAFNEPKKRKFVLPQGAQALVKNISGGRGALKTHLPQCLFYDYYPSEEPQTKASVTWSVPPLPIEKGQEVGLVRVMDHWGRILQERKLLAAEPVNPTFWYRLKMSLAVKAKGKKIVAGIGVGVLLIYFLLLRQKKRSRSSRTLY